MNSMISFWRLFLMLIALPLLTFAGHENGNGGGAIVCRNSQKEIVSVELLDLWEAKAMGARLIKGEGDPDSFIKVALTRLSQNNPLFGSRVRQAFVSNNAIRIAVPSGVHLTPPMDAHNWIMKDNCSLESVAQYRKQADGDRLYIQYELLKKMPPLDQAALWIHEAVYKVLRDDDGEIDSIRARGITSRLFTVEGLPAVANPDIACFQRLHNSRLNYSFVFMAKLGPESVQAAVSRVNGKWQIPSIPVTTTDKVQEKQFLIASRLQHDGASTSNPAKLSVLPLWMQYPLDGKKNLLMAFLTPRVSASQGGVYSFSLFLNRETKTNCILP